MFAVYISQREIDGNTVDESDPKQVIEAMLGLTCIGTGIDVKDLKDAPGLIVDEILEYDASFDMPPTISFEREIMERIVREMIEFEKTIKVFTEYEVYKALVLYAKAQELVGGAK